MKNYLLAVLVIFQCCSIYAGEIESIKAHSLSPVFDSVDQDKKRINVKLIPIVEKLKYPTDIQFPPHGGDWFIVLEKNGNAYKISYQYQNQIITPITMHLLFKQEVLTEVEQGLLGLAFHPNFEKNGFLYIHYSSQKGAHKISRIAKLKVDSPKSPTAIIEEESILELIQPYPNHNGGQLAFGPDGYLYIAFGDGGGANDPNNLSQNSKVFLGKMLRIDVDHPHPESFKRYSIPKDNPYVDNMLYLPEIWNSGLRNPWRFNFLPSGNLIIADVGQNKWEEISIAKKGDNLGWNIKEGSDCFKDESACERSDLIDPIYEYSHREGASIIGGDIATAHDYNNLVNKYIFGDYVSGRLWALSLPTENDSQVNVFALGQWNIQPATFGKDNLGHIFVGDHKKGVIYQIVEE
ncbi:MAG: PQQ-dependent sugar dehydrogenase [Gammaproteobacteria bacterium]